MSLDSYLKWFQSHERLLLVAAVLGIGYFAFNHWVDKSSDVANQKAIIAEQIATEQKQQNAVLAQQIAQQTAAFQQAQAESQRELAVLATQIASRDAASNKQIQSVTSSTTVAQAVTDVNAAYGAKLPTPLTVTEAGSVPIADLQQFTVAEILVGTLQGDLADTRKELDSTSQQLGQSTALVGALQGQVSGLQTELKDTVAADQAQIKAVKLEARKDKVKWFKRGFITGFIGGLIAGHYVGI